jgi:hypothetical protein
MADTPTPVQRGAAPSGRMQRMTRPCRYVAAVTNPWLGDLDVGAAFVERYGPELAGTGAVVEAIAEAAHRFLHRLQELRPAQLVVVGAYPRGSAPGTLREHRLPAQPSDAAEVQARLAESLGGVVDLEHLLVVARYYDALPAATTILEVEPAVTTFDPALSPAVLAALPGLRSRTMELLGVTLR